MLKKTCKGKKIRDNVIFLGTCNPFRVKLNDNETLGLTHEKHKQSKLAYNVHPLPHSLLVFVVEFKTPEKTDIKKYISCITKDFLKESIEDERILNRIQKIAERLISEAHYYFEDKYEISSVSLREINRVEKLFKWFNSKLLRNPYIMKNLNLHNDEKIYFYALNLSIYFCYYLRLYNKNEQKIFEDKMEKNLKSIIDELIEEKKSNENLQIETYNDFKFNEFPLKIEREIANYISIKRGIAKNKTLLENLFVVFVCLNTKIPLYIIGKPGGSKTLSVQLIFESMKGKDSFHEFFKFYPKIYVKSYQGSETSTSSGIKRIFKRAKLSLEGNNNSKDIISVVYFDELGLADISDNNPLKVLQHILENDEEAEMIGFIGISNWILDASKMNRGILYYIKDFDEKDVIDTAEAIADSYDEKLKQNYKEYYKYLSLAYLKYMKKLKKDSENIDNSFIKQFHGKRDFYHLIKLISKLFIKNNFPVNKVDIDNILIESIIRNFDGLENSINNFTNELKKIYPSLNYTRNIDAIDCIIDNLNDNDTRYLMIETKSSISQYLVLSILKLFKKEYICFYGSNFIEDKTEGIYTANILNKIQVNMNKDNVIILKNMSTILPSLYDLFNQNFLNIGDKHFTRIAFEDSNTQIYIVNKNLKIIVFADNNELINFDTSLINRVENHILSCVNCLDRSALKLATDIFNIIVTFCNDHNKKLRIGIKSQLINLDFEEICSIIYRLIKNDISKFDTNINNTDIISIKSQLKTRELKSYDVPMLKNKIFKKIVSTFSQDLLLYIKNSENCKVNKEELENIISLYLEEEDRHKCIKNYLEKIVFTKHIIYTYSNILESIFGSNNEITCINNEIFGSFTKNNTLNIFINEYNSENEIFNCINNFYTKTTYKLLVIHFDNEKFNFLHHINYLIENYEKSLPQTQTLKPIILMIHLKRLTNKNKNENYDNHKINSIIPKEYLISHISELEQFFIDNINGKYKINDVINISKYELFEINSLIDLTKELENELYHLFSFILYDVKINFTDINEEKYIVEVCELILNNSKLKEYITLLSKNKIILMDKNIIMEVFTNYNFEENDCDFISILVKYMKKIYKNALVSSIIQLEKYNLLTCILLNNYNNKKYFNNLSNNIFKKLLRTNTPLNSHSVFEREKINLYMGIVFPGINMEFEEINEYILRELSKDYKNNEIEYKLMEKENYEKTKNNLEYNIIKKCNDLIFSNKDYECVFNDEYINEEILLILLKDYIIYYLSSSSKKFTNRKLLNIFIELYNIFFEVNSFIYIQYTVESISKYILFIESFKNYIIVLIEFINYLDTVIENVLNVFIHNLKKKTFMKNNDNEISFVKNILYNMFESVFYCIINSEQNFNTISTQEFDMFINELTNISNFSIKAKIDLNLDFKQLLYVQDILYVNEAFDKLNIPLVKENFHEYIAILKKENNLYLLQKHFNINTSEYGDPIIEEFNFLKNKLSSEIYMELLVKLMNNKLKISEDENYRKKLLIIISSYENCIHKFKSFFKLLFNKYNIYTINQHRKNKDKKPYDNDNNYDYSDVFFSLNNKNENYFDFDDNNKSENINFFDIEFDNDICYFENDFDNNNDDDIENYIDNNSSTYKPNDEYYDEDKGNTGSYNSTYKNNNDDLNNINIYRFLIELNKDITNPIITYLNESNNDILDEVLLLIFDEYITDYFNSQYHDKDKILNNTFLVFKKLVKYIDSNNYEINNNNKLGILYCISYIKCYCYHFSKILYDNDTINQLDLSEIWNFLNNPAKSRKIIKLYILRVLNKIIIKNYTNLLKFIKQKKLFIDDFDFSEKSQFPLSNLFLQKDSYENYLKLRKLYRLSKIENFKHNNEIFTILNKETLLSFYDLIINEEISNLCKNEQFNENYYKKLCRFVINITDNLKLPLISENILSVFYNYSIMKKELNSFIKNLSPNEFEILLYSHKFAFICSLSKPNTFYSNILSPNVIKYINKAYVIGGEPEYSILMDSAKEIQEYFEKNGTNKLGAYICSCGKSYYIEDCTQPYGISLCTRCKEPIGGNDHNLLHRKGHMRIFENQEEKLKNNHIPGKLINDFLNDIKRKKNTNKPGVIKVLKEYFLSIHKEVRNIINVTYRTLSFIFYSCILFDFILLYINENDIMTMFTYEDENKTIFSILVDIWNVLNIELRRKGIENNVPCFLNMVIPEISYLILNNEFRIENADERDIFERKCNKIIESALINLNFNNYNQQYIANSNEILNLNDDTIKCILEESSNINELPKNEYPLIKYFYASDYSTFDMFFDKFNLLPDKYSKYPILSTYVDYLMEKQHKLKILESFNLINPLILYVLQKYSNKILRNEAKKTKIRDELKKDKYMKKLFENFKKGWNQSCEHLSNFDCNGRMDDISINEDSCLAYILNDISDNGYGKYIATFYNDVISIQNDILEKMIIPNNSRKEYLQHYKYQIERRIMVQDATSNELISFDINNELYRSFDSLIFTFSDRNYFKNQNENTINHTDHKSIKYYFENIEEALSNLLLPGKRLFLSKDFQNLITYKNEGFTQNFNIIYDFKQKIKNENDISNKNKHSIKEIMENFDYNIILINLQSLFLYFSKRNIDGSESLLREIEQLPSNIIKLDSEFKRFIKDNQLEIKLNQLISLYDFVELINYEKIKSYVSKQAYKMLDIKQICILNSHFKQNNLLIRIKDYYYALIKLISRYLISEQFNSYNWDIFELLTKSELWNYELTCTPEIESRFNDELKSLNSKFNEAKNCDTIRINQIMKFEQYLSYKMVKNKKT